MQRSSVLVLLLALPVAACSSNDGTPSDTGASGSVVFKPPAPAEGYQRLSVSKIPDITPGSDVTYCQYIMGGLDHDVDILKLNGYQSEFGHHIVAFSFTDDGTKEIGSSTPCMGTEVSSGDPSSLDIGGYLGGIAGSDDKSNSGSPLPEGVAFRLKQGNGIMLNVHFLNTSERTVDGEGVIDLLFADPDPNRLIASLFVNVNMKFNLPAHGQAESSIDCVAQSDTKVIVQSNHMHEYGLAASTEIQRAGTSTFEMLHEDPAWTYDMQFNIQYTRWEAADPLVIHAGDTIRTKCAWQNTSSADMTFPREMCIGLGFALVPPENPRAPGCVNGAWIPELL